MTVLDPASPRAAAARCAQGACLRWSGLRLTPGVGAVPVALELRWRPDGIDGIRFDAVLVDADGSRVIEQGLADATIITDDGLLHVDAGGADRRLLALTWEVGTGRLLYARSDLVNDLAPGLLDPPVCADGDSCPG